MNWLFRQSLVEHIRSTTPRRRAQDRAWLGLALGVALIIVAILVTP